MASLQRAAGCGRQECIQQAAAAVQEQPLARSIEQAQGVRVGKVVPSAVGWPQQPRGAWHSAIRGLLQPTARCAAAKKWCPCGRPAQGRALRLPRRQVSIWPPTRCAGWLSAGHGCQSRGQRSATAGAGCERGQHAARAACGGEAVGTAGASRAWVGAEHGQTVHMHGPAGTHHTERGCLAAWRVCGNQASRAGASGCNRPQRPGHYSPCNPQAQPQRRRLRVLWARHQAAPGRATRRGRAARRGRGRGGTRLPRCRRRARQGARAARHSLPPLQAQVLLAVAVHIGGGQEGGPAAISMEHGRAGLTGCWAHRWGPGEWPCGRAGGWATRRRPCFQPQGLCFTPTTQPNA